MDKLFKEGVRWEIHPDFRSVWEAVLSLPGRIIKESPAKRVSECHYGGRIYFVKRYRHDSHPWRSLKFFFKRSQARREWELAGQLEARGIPIVRHLALGDHWGWFGLRESVLVTEGFPGQPVEGTDAAEIKAVLAFVERMHQAGVIQHDLHGANLLWNSARAEIRLVDLDGCEIKDEISPEERARNLAFLRMTMPVPVPPTVAELSSRMRKEAAAYRSKRAWKHNREFAPRPFGPLRWQVRLPLEDERATRILADPDGFLRGAARLLKCGRSATVGAADGFVLKRYNFKKPLNLVKDMFRPARAWRAFRMAYQLELVGVRTARPVAAAVRRRLGLVVGSYFLMREIPKATALHYYAGDPAKAVGEAAHLLARLHDEGFFHRDLKASNLVFDSEGQLYLIDLEGLHFSGEVSAARARADLARLWRSVRMEPSLTRRHLVVFMKRYCRHRGIPLRVLLPRNRRGARRTSCPTGA